MHETNGEGRRVEGSRSILFLQPQRPGAEEPQEPAFFTDLNLDQVLASMTKGREQYHLEPFFYAPLRDVAAVHHRHQVVRDLEREAVSGPIGAFAQKMRKVREQLAQADKLRHELQKQRWFVDAVDTYRVAVTDLADALTVIEPRSPGLRAFREHLSGYAASPGFASLATETEGLNEALAGVSYCIHIRGNRVRVSRYDGEADYSAEVVETFARFKQGAVKDHRVKLRDWVDMDHVEGRIAELVARLHPEVFAALRTYCARHRDFLDETVGAFDREVQFYLAYLDYIERFKAAGLPFCYPAVSTRSKVVRADAAFDLALANRLVPDGAGVVGNDLHLDGPERIIVVTGPNQGGKTTFARMFGQLHYLASLGLPVPGTSARLFLPDRIFTHFEREETLATLRGKLEDDLIRIHSILHQATSDSIVIMNESFTSTTLSDALLLGTEVMNQMIELGALVVCVTFVDELASLGDRVISMVSTVAPDNPAVRTYRVVRRPADGLAYAAAIADKYGLAYDLLRRRIA